MRVDFEFDKNIVEDICDMILEDSSMENKKIDFEVVQQIEVLREFAAGVLADLRCYMEKENIDSENNENLIAVMYDTVVDEYDAVYNIRSMKEAMIARGKLQIINESLKKVVVENTPCSNIHDAYRCCQDMIECYMGADEEFSGIENENEREFYLTIRDLFMKQKQRKLVENEVY